MLFTYSAKTKKGEIFETTVEAVSRYVLARDIKARGYVPLSITEKDENLIDKISNLEENLLSKVSINEQIIFTKNLSGMLRAGLSLSRALSVLKKQTKNLKLGKILTSLTADIDAGESFSAA